MNQFSIERNEYGFTVLKNQQAIATFKQAGEAIEAMRQFQSRPVEVGKAGVPPMIANMKARLHSQLHRA